MADEKQKTVYRILGYLVQNPKAQDTLEGIVEWWLLERHARAAVLRVKEALAELVGAGLVLERRGEGSRIYYKLNPLKLKEITALLRTETEPGNGDS
jgi:DNA-binding transcriptional ArsR family regulator